MKAIEAEMTADDVGLRSAEVSAAHVIGEQQLNGAAVGPYCNRQGVLMKNELWPAAGVQAF